MTRDEMNAVVAEELASIPREAPGSAQNLYRAAYQFWRMNSLGSKPEIPCSLAAAHRAALASVRSTYPDFTPDLPRLLTTPMQLFISHSSKDRKWVELVRKRIEEQGFSAYLAEYDLQPGSHLAAKIQEAIAASDAVVVVLTENAANSPIVREEIGYSLALHKRVVPLVTPTVARDGAMLGMLNGLEYVPFDIDSPQEGLLRLTDWVHKFALAQQAAAYEAQLAQLQAQRDALLLLVFVGAVAAVVLLTAE